MGMPAVPVIFSMSALLKQMHDFDFKYAKMEHYQSIKNRKKSDQNQCRMGKLNSQFNLTQLKNTVLQQWDVLGTCSEFTASTFSTIQYFWDRPFKIIFLPQLLTALWSFYCPPT